MKSEYYEPYALAEEKHWWFAARRAILREVLRTFRLRHGATILEVGCASGGNLKMLREFGQTKACEYDEGILDLARRRHPDVEIERCELPGEIPFGNEAFDLIGLFDVLEHVDDDRGALRALRSRLRPGGRLVLTVPAFPWLWSAHDEVNLHHRRYTRESLVDALRDAGLEMVKGSYFNLLLLPLIQGIRLVADFLKRDPADQLEPPHPLVNGILATVMSSERSLVAGRGLPCGVSLLAVAMASEPKN